LAELQTGPFGTQLHSYDYRATGVPIVPTEALRNRRIDHSVLPKISTEKARELQRHRLRAGDILFARRGAQATGHIGYVRSEEDGFICGTGAIRLRVCEDATVTRSDFLSHVFADPASIAWFKFHAIGATMPNLNEGIISAFPLHLPPIAEQKAIASLLSALDDKIALNKQMALTLEGIARTLFQSWFVDFDPVRHIAAGQDSGLSTPIAGLFPATLEQDGLPEGWAWESLERLVRIVRTTVQPSDLPADTPYVGLEHIAKKRLTLETIGTASNVDSQKIVFAAGDILFGKLRSYFHKVAIAPFNGICSSDILVMRCNDEILKPLISLTVSSEKFVELSSAAATGTRMPRADWAQMSSHRIAVPTGAVLRRFNEVIIPIFARLDGLRMQNASLATLRDTLLPKLISGEVTVRGAEQIMTNP
jgi:type I restriction enzyme S subunit